MGVGSPLPKPKERGLQAAAKIRPNTNTVNPIRSTMLLTIRVAASGLTTGVLRIPDLPTSFPASCGGRSGVDLKSFGHASSPP